MATVYKIEIVSDWINYPIDELKKIIQEALTKVEREKGNEIRVKVITRN